MKHFYVGILVPLTTLIPIGLGLKNKVFKVQKSKIIFFYLVFCFFINVAATIIAQHHTNNLPLLHIYTLIEFILILTYFKLTLINGRSTFVINMLLVILPAVSIGNLLLTHDVFSFNTYIRTISAIIITTLCMLHLYKISESDQKDSWAVEAKNWYTSGLLVYFCSSLIYFAFLNTIAESASMTVYNIFSNIHGTLVIVMYCLFTVGFTKSRYA